MRLLLTPANTISSVLSSASEYNTLDIPSIITINPTRCTNFSNLFLEWNSKRLGQFPCLSSGVFHCKYNNGICHTCLLTACEQDQDGARSIPILLASCQKTCMTYTSVVYTVKIPDDGQRNCPKHVVLFQKYVWEISASIWFYYKKLSRCTATRTSSYKYLWMLHYLMTNILVTRQCYHT